MHGKTLFTSRGPTAVLYDDEAAASAVYGPLQHAVLPAEAMESRKRNPPPPVVWTSCSRQSAVVVGRAAFCPRPAATVASSAHQTRTADSDAVQADMTANGVYYFVTSGASGACAVADGIAGVLSP